MTTDTKALLDQIAAEMKKPRPNQKLLDRLNKKLDQALGTELKDDDQELAEAYESSRR